MMIPKENRLIYNFFSLGTVQAISSLIQLLVVPHVISKIGIDGFGVVAVAQAVMLLLSAFTDYGFNQSAVRDISLYRTDSAAISKIFYTVLFSKLVLCVLAFLSLIVLVLSIPLFRANSLVFLMAFAFVIGQSVFVNWFFQGIEKMQIVALLTLLARIIFMILVFAFIKGKDDDRLFLFFMGAGNFIAGLASIYAARRISVQRFKMPSRAGIIRELGEGWRITVANLSGFSSQYANIFILRIFTNDLLVGYYSIAERIFFAMKQVLVVFSQVIYPKVCTLVQNGRSRVLLFLKQTYIPFFVCVVFGCGLVYILAPRILHFFIGAENVHSLFLLRIFCAVIIIICMNIPACLVLLAAKGTTGFLRVIMAGTFLNIASNIVLVRFFDEKGTVLSIVITEVFITIGLYWEVYRMYIRIKGEHESFLKLFLQDK